MAETKKTSVKDKNTNENYPIHVIGRHIDVTDAMKTYAMDKLKKIERFGGRVVDAFIVMDIQKTVHNVDFIINVNNIIIKVSGRTENMYSSVDQALEHLKNKLSRYHKRLSEHQALGIADIEMNVNVIQTISHLDEINDQIEEENLRAIEKNLHPNHKIVSKEKHPLSQMNQNEAIMKLDLSGDNFMIYRSEEDRKLKVIYRRDDGNYGIIEPE